MKHTLRQVFRSGKFVVGFSVFSAVLLIVIIYPLIVPYPPLEIISQGTFFPPGIYVNVYDSIGSTTHYTLNLDNAAAKRIASTLGNDDRHAMKDWLVAVGIPEVEIDIADTAKLIEQWESNFDPKVKIAGMTNAQRNYYIRLNASLEGLLSTEGAIIAANNPDAGTLEEKGIIAQSDYVNIREVPNVRVLPLGTDNFGRDVLTELVKATGVSLLIGFVAGIVATAITKEQESAQLVLGLLQFPMMFLSGVFFPVEQMPTFLQTVSKVLPLTYAVEALRKVMILGAGIDAVIGPLAILVALGTVTMILGVPLFDRAVKR